MIDIYVSSELKRLSRIGQLNWSLKYFSIFNA